MTMMTSLLHSCKNMPLQILHCTFVEQVVMDVLLYGMKHAESYTSQLILHRVDAIIDLLYGLLIF